MPGAIVLRHNRGAGRHAGEAKPDAQHRPACNGLCWTGPPKVGPVPRTVQAVRQRWCGTGSRAAPSPGHRGWLSRPARGPGTDCRPAALAGAAPQARSYRQCRHRPAARSRPPTAPGARSWAAAWHAMRPGRPAGRHSRRPGLRHPRFSSRSQPSQGTFTFSQPVRRAVRAGRWPGRPRRSSWDGPGQLADLPAPPAGLGPEPGTGTVRAGGTGARDGTLYRSPGLRSLKISNDGCHRFIDSPATLGGNWASLTQPPHQRFDPLCRVMLLAFCRWGWYR